MENANKTASDFDDSPNMDMPEGFKEVTQTRLWVVKEEGAILQGVILQRVQRKDQTKETGYSYYYELRLARECKTTTADEEDGKKKIEVIASAGQIVCIDEFAANGNWQHQIPVAGKATEVWMKFIRKDKLDGLKTMWKVKQGQRHVNIRDLKDDSIPF